LDQNLRVLFDRALADEPEPTSENLAGQVMAIGQRRRLRRFAWAGGAAVALVAALGVANLAAPTAGSPPLETVPARFESALNPACESPARDRPTDLSVFLTQDITDEQRAAVEQTLRSDQAVATVAYESSDEAYLVFMRMFSDKPELVEAVQPHMLPESFRLKVDDHSRYVELVLRMRKTPGVDQVIDSACPDGVSVGMAG
jgi:FtsX extracellular domain